MILTIDIGNSNVVLALFKEEEILYNWRLKTRKKNIDLQEYKKEIKELFEKDNLNEKDIEGIIISSVVPELTPTIKEALESFKVKILTIGDKGVKTNIKVKIDKPETLGSDILMNTVAGKIKFKKNFVIIDMGTATTFNIVDENGDFIGAVIAPGVKLSCKALSEGCSKLPECLIGLPNKTIGRNTRDAMNAGIYFGHISMIKGMIERIEKELGRKMKTCITGGMSYKFFKNMPFIDEIDKDLTLKGLKIVWNRNF